MKNKTFLAVSLFSFLLAGCGSTSKSDLPGPEFNGHPLQIASTDTYEWDTDKSFALNIAEMARPAGVGYGLVDVQDPKNLEISRSGNALVSGALGFMAGGVGGALGYLSMDAQSDEKRDWRPSIITFYEESELDLSDLVNANMYIRNDVGAKVAKALTAAYPETVYDGTYPWHSKSLNSAVTVLSGDICSEAFAYGHLEGHSYDTNEPLKRFKNLIKDGSTSLEEGCPFMFESKVIGKIGDKIAVSSEISSFNVNTFILLTAKDSIKDAFILTPDRIQYHVDGNRRKHYRVMPYPALYGNGKEYLFDANETSSGI